MRGFYHSASDKEQIVMAVNNYLMILSWDWQFVKCLSTGEYPTSHILGGKLVFLFEKMVVELD